METTTSVADRLPYSYTVFLDLDRTIISKVSGKAIAVNAVRKGYLKKLELLKISVTYLLFKTRMIDPQMMMGKMIGWTCGMHETRMNELCAETTEKSLIPSIYMQARNEIDFHKKNNARIVILSSSIYPVCSAIAEKIGADDIICTLLEINNGSLSGNADGNICFHEEKTTRLREYCAIHNIIVYESWYYGDSASDLPVFLAVGSPVCVNPDMKLRRTAMKKGWKVLNWSD